MSDIRSTNGSEGRTQCLKLMRFLSVENNRVDNGMAYFDFGISRLASRIHDLRALGLKIDSDWHKYRDARGDKKRYMVYWLDLTDSKTQKILKTNGVIE